MSTQSATVLVDSNVLLDVLTEDSRWLDWSAAALEAPAEDSRLAVNPLIYAEVSIGFERVEELDEALPSSILARLPLPWPAAFLAGKCTSHTVGRAGNAARRSRISTSAPMRLLRGCAC